jgi:hypothetical protein
MGGTTFISLCRDYAVRADAVVSDAVGLRRVELEYGLVRYRFAVGSIISNGIQHEVLAIASASRYQAKKTLLNTAGDNFSLSFSVINTVSGALTRTWDFLDRSVAPVLVATDVDGNIVRVTLSW